MKRTRLSCKNHRHFSTIIFTAICIISTTMLGCGGGGGGGGSTSGGGGGLAPASLDQRSAQVATVLAMSTNDISDFSDMWLDSLPRSSSLNNNQRKPLGVWALNKLREAIFEGTIINGNSLARSGSDSETMYCYDSGSIAFSGTWTGPDEPTDVCQIVDIQATLTINNCTEYGESVNGVVTLSVTGNLCDPTAIAVGFNNLSFSDTYSGVSIYSDNFNMSLSLISGSFDDPSYIRTNMNGDISMDGISVEFSDYTEELRINGSTAEVTVNGALTGTCLDGWVTFTTLVPIISADGSDCPYEGQVRISGSGDDFMVTFNSDGSMTIGDTYYASCEDPEMPESCGF